MKCYVQFGENREDISQLKQIFQKDHISRIISRKTLSKEGIKLLKNISCHDVTDHPM